MYNKGGLFQSFELLLYIFVSLWKQCKKIILILNQKYVFILKCIVILKYGHKKKTVENQMYLISNVSTFPINLYLEPFLLRFFFISIHL